ncbi:MAG: ABC transporter ATP-binding protein [Gammaproteobacteria bacterium]|nr:ABC transporter ATP-binding protein [Gammaproteobacteria bacterium]
MLQINEIWKSYLLGREKLPVLQGLSLSLVAGEILIIMGPSGSGKTTLLNCISGIDTPDRGDIVIGGNPVDFSSQRALTLLRRHDIGMVFQFFNLIPTLTVRENIALPFLIVNRSKTEYQEIVTEMLQRVGMSHREKHYPFQLSGGEMQLVSIARSLVHQPRLLLADEPTGNVNPRIARGIMQILRDTVKSSDVAFIMVTHSPEHAAWGNRIAFLRDGRIIDELEHDGDPQNLTLIYDRLVELEI